MSFRDVADVRVACGPGWFLTRALARLDVPCVVLPNLVRPISPRNDLRALLALRAVVAEFEPDVVHSHTAKAGALVRLLRLGTGRRRRWRSIYTPHNWSFNNPNDAGSALVNRWVERLLAPLTDVIICVSEAERRLALDIGIHRARTRVVYSPRSIPNAILAECPNPSPDVFRLTWVGRLEGHKDPETAIEAVSMLPAAVRARLEFVIVGEGKKFASIAARAGAAGLPVRMAGACDNETALAWMKSSNAVVVSSSYEPFGLVVLEALGIGTPVIASACGGIVEILRDGVEGLLFLPGDAAALAAAIQRLIDDPALGERLRAHGLRRYAAFQAMDTRSMLANIYGNGLTAGA